MKQNAKDYTTIVYDNAKDQSILVEGSAEQPVVLPYIGP
jgi:hypothetical protein